MASRHFETQVRIGAGLLAIALAGVSLFMMWAPPTGDYLFRNLQTAMAGVVIVMGLMVCVGRSRSGRLVLTRRRWRFALLLAVTVLGAAVLLLDTGWFTRAPTPIAAIFPIFVGLGLAPMFEPEATVGFKASDLSEKDAKTWRRILWACVLLTVVLGASSVFAAVSGNPTLGALMLPFAGLFLSFVFVIWILLRARIRQLRPH
jgi:hypothetical protein